MLFLFCMSSFQKTPKVDFTWNKYGEKSFTFYDNRVVEEVQSGNEDAQEFFRLLSLCHTVMSENKDGKFLEKKKAFTVHPPYFAIMHVANFP